MKDPDSCVVDTMVLRKANAPINFNSKSSRDFRKRIALLRRIENGELQILISSKLLHEYRSQILEPRNDFIKSFFEILTIPGRHRANYCRPWPGRDRERQRKCRFPSEDEHVLRTAVVAGERTTIFSEEDRMLRTNECIYRNFEVRIVNPVKP